MDISYTVSTTHFSSSSLSSSSESSVCFLTGSGLACLFDSAASSSKTSLAGRFDAMVSGKREREYSRGHDEMPVSKRTKTTHGLGFVYVLLLLYWGRNTQVFFCCCCWPVCPYCQLIVRSEN